jgi:hypothetical protein
MVLTRSVSNLKIVPSAAPRESIVQASWDRKATSSCSCRSMSKLEEGREKWLADYLNLHQLSISDILFSFSSLSLFDFILSSNSFLLSLLAFSLFSFFLFSFSLFSFFSFPSFSFSLNVFLSLP